MFFWFLDRWTGWTAGWVTGCLGAGWATGCFGAGWATGCFGASFWTCWTIGCDSWSDLGSVLNCWPNWGGGVNGCSGAGCFSGFGGAGCFGGSLGTGEAGVGCGFGGAGSVL